MSLLPTIWPAVEYRGESVCRVPPRVIVKGDPDAVADMMPVFKKAYVDAVRNSLAPGIAPQQLINKRFDGGAKMTIVSNHLQDTVYLYAEAGESGLPRSAFLVTMDGGTQQRIYPFDFDKTDFKFMEAKKRKAGIMGIKARDVFVSWDGTGGGNVAHECLPHTLPKNLPLSAYKPEPYAALSGKLYADCKEYPFVEGNIYGVGIKGGDVIVATASGTRMTFHSGGVDFDEVSQTIETISYGEPIGYIDLGEDAAAIVNFDSTLTRAVCGNRIITIPGKQNRTRGVSTLFASAKIEFEPKDVIVSAGFKPHEVKGQPDILCFTLRRETLKVVGGYTAPTTALEYSAAVSGWNDSESSHVSKQTVDIAYEYFDLEYSASVSVPDTPSRKGTVHKDLMATVIKKPIIVFKGFYPTTLYSWMRTITQEETQAENIFYWFRDYKTDQFVRCNWSRGYVKTAQYDEYGAFPPVETEVLNTYANNINKQTVVMGGLWFYTVTNGKGDFILRKKPNGVLSDAMLVSKSGKTKIIANTRAIAIF